MIIFANVMDALASRLAAGLAPTKVERNREVPTRFGTPTDTTVAEYVVLHDGDFEAVEGKNSNQTFAWTLHPTIRLEVATKTPDVVASALYDLLGRAMAIIFADRRLGLGTNAGIFDVLLAAGNVEIFEAEGSSPGGALEATLAITVMTNLSSLAMAA